MTSFGDFILHRTSAVYFIKKANFGELLFLVFK